MRIDVKKLTLIALLFLSIDGVAQTKNFIDQNYIEVTGKAELEIIPNEIYLQIILDEKDFKGKEHLVDLEQAMINKLQSINIDIKKDLVVMDMASNFQSYWIKSSEIKTVKKYQLKVSDSQTAGAVFQALESIDISNVTILRVDHSEMTELRQQVKVEAIRAARKKAEYLTEAIDQSCGRAIYIQELRNEGYNSLKGYAMGINSNVIMKSSNAVSSNATPNIEFEKIHLVYSILVRFEIN